MKYEFTGEKKTFCGVELKRIRAVEDNKRYGVAAGELGGWIESEKNLEQSGNTRVYGDFCRRCGAKNGDGTPPVPAPPEDARMESEANVDK